MKIVIFTHPDFSQSQSMPRFAKMLSYGLESRGHSTEIWQPSAFFYNIPAPASVKKWFGYLDQFYLFPKSVNRKLRSIPKETLFVFSDHALGPWIPLVSMLPHVVHCHDFLAQRSAGDEITENQLSFTGKLYQKYIRTGYQKANNFISVSKKTQFDLHQFLNKNPTLSEVVYNGLNRSFNKGNKEISRRHLTQSMDWNAMEGFLLHVGGNQWYKNRGGVIELYNGWRMLTKQPLPLILVGATPDQKLKKLFEESPFKNDIYFFTQVNDDLLNHFYVGASVFLFPSIAEGFGWPIIEAMASGTLVITTNEDPMKEVGGDAAIYIEKRPSEKNLLNNWISESALIIEQAVNFAEDKLICITEKGLANIKRFEAGKSIDQIEAIYKLIIERYDENFKSNI